LEEALGHGILQHFNETNENDETYRFVSSIGTTDNTVEFKEHGEVYLRLSKDNQVFEITQLQQNHRLCGLKNLIQHMR
jgi:hypothetical protein